jgi:hypothetical protein
MDCGGSGRSSPPTGSSQSGMLPDDAQHPFQLLGALDERLTKTLVRPGAALRIGSGDVPLWIAHADEGSAKPSRSR